MYSCNRNVLFDSVVTMLVYDLLVLDMDTHSSLGQSNSKH